MRRNRPDDDGRRTRPSPIDVAEQRWQVGTPAVPGALKRTLAALFCLVVLIALLYLMYLISS